jgi:hypothetical protein
VEEVEQGEDLGERAERKRRGAPNWGRRVEKKEKVNDQTEAKGSGEQDEGEQCEQGERSPRSKHRNWWKR